MIKVANIVEEGKLGGPHVRIANVAKALEGRVSTTVIVPYENSTGFCKRLDRLGIPFKQFKISRITKDWKAALIYVFRSPIEIFNLYRFFRREKFDILHVSGGAWQFKGVIAGKLANTKVVWHLNDTYLPWVFRIIFKGLSSLPCAYIFASERTRDYYHSYLPRSLKVEMIIPAPVDTKLFRNDMVDVGQNDLLVSLDGKFVVGTVANVSPVKGLDTFVRAAAEINKFGRDFHFVIAGRIFEAQYAYYKSLLKLASRLGVENLSFTDGIDDVKPYLKRFDVYVCSSVAESSPISVWEAMSMEKAVVSTDVGDVPKYIKSGESGEVVPVSDHELLAKKVHSIKNDESKKICFEQAARQTACKFLDIDICAENHFEMYRNLAD